MPLTLYMMPACANCRATYMCARALKVDFKVEWVSLDEKGTKSPEFLKMNPLHSVPTMDDDGFYMSESRAIAMYLASNHSQDETSLYPKEPKKRAQVESFLFYDVGTVYKVIRNWVYPQMIPNWSTEIGPETLPAMKEQLDKLEQIFLAKSDYLFGDSMTLADLSLCASVTLLLPFDFDLSPWSRLSAWLDRLKMLPYFEECNKPGFDRMTKMKGVVAKQQKQK